MEEDGERRGRAERGTLELVKKWAGLAMWAVGQKEGNESAK